MKLGREIRYNLTQFLKEITANPAADFKAVKEIIETILSGQEEAIKRAVMGLVSNLGANPTVVKDNVASCCLLGLCYLEEIGVPEEDQDLACKLLKAAADQNCTDAQCSLGKYLREDGEDKDDKKKAFELFERAAKLGNPRADFELGMCFYVGNGTSKSSKNAVEYWHRAAKKGYVGAQYSLGWRYANGAGVPKDDMKAYEYYKQAADQGDPFSQFEVGKRLTDGIGVLKDEEKAIEYYQRSADQGYAEAQFALGACFENGIGVKKDQEKAVILYRRASEQNNGDAQFALGSCYEHRKGVEKDMVTATRLYRLAASQRIAEACFALADYYYVTSKKFDEEERIAFELCHQAASILGHPKAPLAQYRVGLCYEQDKGTPRNVKAAIEYYQRAAKNGHADAQIKLDQLLGKCPPLPTSSATNVTSPDNIKDNLPDLKLHQDNQAQVTVMVPHVAKAVETSPLVFSKSNDLLGVNVKQNAEVKAKILKMCSELDLLLGKYQESKPCDLKVAIVRFARKVLGCLLAEEPFEKVLVNENDLMKEIKAKDEEINSLFAKLSSTYAFSEAYLRSLVEFCDKVNDTVKGTFSWWVMDCDRASHCYKSLRAVLDSTIVHDSTIQRKIVPMSQNS